MEHLMSSRLNENISSQNSKFLLHMSSGKIRLMEEQALLSKINFFLCIHILILLSNCTESETTVSCHLIMWPEVQALIRRRAERAASGQSIYTFYPYTWGAFTDDVTYFDLLLSGHWIASMFSLYEIVCMAVSQKTTTNRVFYAAVLLRFIIDFATSCQYLIVFSECWIVSKHSPFFFLSEASTHLINLFDRVSANNAQIITVGCLHIS